MSEKENNPNYYIVTNPDEIPKDGWDKLLRTGSCGIHKTYYKNGWIKIRRKTYYNNDINNYTNERLAFRKRTEEEDQEMKRILDDMDRRFEETREHQRDFAGVKRKGAMK